MTAWAAGLFEGEGCFARNGLHGLRMEMAMADEDVMRRFHATIGVGNIKEIPPTRPGHKKQWRWCCADWEQVEQIMSVFWPWLGERRQDRYLEFRYAISLDRSPGRRKPRQDVCHMGHDDWGIVGTKGKRRCLTCRREADREWKAAKRMELANGPL
jgi:hypothetical protein